MGKLVEKVAPTTYAYPFPSRAIPRAPSSEEPPKKVENTRLEPVEFRVVRKASPQVAPTGQGLVPPPNVGWVAFAVTGKLDESVIPAR